MIPHIPIEDAGGFRPSRRYRFRHFLLAVDWPPVWMTAIVIGGAAICFWLALVVLP